MSDRRSFDALAPSAADRERWLARLDEAGAHADIARDLACLSEVDVEVAAGEWGSAAGWLRVAAWNIERGRDPAAIASLILSTDADVALLSEVDVGMGRTRNLDVAREIVRHLGAGLSVFGVEFVELALGKEADRVGVMATENSSALHGNAIVATVALDRPEVFRLDQGGDWFTASRGEPRVGGRCAVIASTSLDGVTVDLASVHLESHSNAPHRARQFTALLDHLDARGARATVVGGDLNTFGGPLAELADRANIHRMREADPARFSWPVEYEPLFEEAAKRGYSWVDANVAAPTTYHDATGQPDHVPVKLDWILVRGLEARRAVVVHSAGADGTKLSDHELLAVSVRLPR